MLRSATESDAARIRALLESNGLPTADLFSSRPEFVVACEADTIIGAGALERLGRAALLRSVAVTATRRGAGIGTLLLRELEERARRSGVSDLLLLTETARAFFERHGYRVIDRESVPSAVRMTEEFRALCPASATCMAKALGAHAPKPERHA
jgi:amino-acid N-acetyltransferase